MKKYILLLLILVLLAPMNSCDSVLDSYADTPNNPTETEPNLLLTALEVATFGSYTGNIVRLPAIYVQQIAGTSEGQFGAYSRYDVTEQTIGNEWSTLYAKAIHSGTTLIRLFPKEYDDYNAMAKILLAFNFGVATDLWGDVPFSEASKAIVDENLSPKYDSQEDIIKGIQSMLDDAIALLTKSNPVNKKAPKKDDIIFAGNKGKWLKVAHLLKARYFLRIVKRDPSAYDNALTSLTNANLKDNEDDMNAIFPNSGGNSKNQWKDFENARKNYIKMGGFFIDLMKSINDPRLPFFATTDKSGGYSGNILGDINTLTTSSVGVAIASDTKPIGLLTFVEGKFMEAEIYLQKGDNVKAKEAFKVAVEASLQKVVGKVNSTFVNNVTATVTLENIMTQKYIALFSSLEPYNDFRRTGFPALKVNPKAEGGVSVIPVRFPTSATERLYNKNATIIQDITKPVWWDN